MDDGSPDDCGKICDDYAANDNRIKVIHKENGGPISARNAGFEVVRGEWHMYIDGDDWMDLNTCESVANYFSLYPDVDLYFWKVVQNLGDREIVGKWGWPCPDEIHLYKGKECHELAKHTMIYKSGLTTTYGKLFNTKWAKENNICGDYRLRQGAECEEFALRTFYYARKVMFINAYYNHYRYVEGSLSKMVSEENTRYILDCFKVIEEDIDKFENKGQVKRMFYQRVFYCLVAQAMNTYFYPQNPERPLKKIRKFSQLVDTTPIFKDAIRKCPLDYMDKLRIVLLYIMKLRMYFLLPIISKLKYYMLSKGYYSY